MALTRSFKDTVRARMQADPDFRTALLTEAVNTMPGGDVEPGKAVLRDYIKATVGVEGLSRVNRHAVEKLDADVQSCGKPCG